MAETLKMNVMNSEILNSNGKACEYEEKGAQKISVLDQINGSFKSDSFIVDMERLPQITEKDITVNSRITLQRSLSRKPSLRGAGEKKTSSGVGNERDATCIATSPRALQGATTPEKPSAVALGTTATDHAINPQVHNQITIMTVNGTTATTENKIGGKRLSFRRSASSWAIDPRRILFFFATLSSIGTILLIYFTLSMGKFNSDDKALN